MEKGQERSRFFGGVALVAGTCIGSGTLALPLLLGHFGIGISLLLMGVIWLVHYYSALLCIEVTLQAGPKEDLSIGKLAQRFSGKTAGWLGTTGYVLFSYALVIAYLVGGSSIVEKMLQEFGIFLTRGVVLISILAIGSGIFIFSVKVVDSVNRVLFLGMLGVFLTLIIGLLASMNTENLPLGLPHFGDSTALGDLKSSGAGVGANGTGMSPLEMGMLALPVLFGSFGFEGITHSLVSYCHGRADLLRRVVFWGLVLPLIVYVAWTLGALSVLWDKDPLFYKKMVSGTIDPGSLVQALSRITQWKAIQWLVWVLSLLAIFTSFLGVGLGLTDAFKEQLSRAQRGGGGHAFAVAMTLIPSGVIAYGYPQAFLKLLSFAGTSLVVLFILLPAFFLWRIFGRASYYPELSTPRIAMLLACGILIIIGEIITALA